MYTGSFGFFGFFRGLLAVEYVCNAPLNSPNSLNNPADPGNCGVCF